MSKHPHIENFDELIVRYLEGYATEVEVAQIEAWMAASPENKAEYDDLASIWSTAPEAAILDNLNIEADWKNVQAQVGLGKSSGQSSGKSSGKSADTPKLKAVKGEAVKSESSEAGATVRSMPGRSAWLRNVAAAVAMLLVAGGAYLFMQNNDTTKLPGGADIALADGTKIWLNEGAHVDAPDAFASSERRIKLTGEAFFEVAHNPEKPFIIETGKTEVQVLGTSFNISNKNKQTEIVVTTGKVKFTGHGETTESVLLEKGDKGVFDQKKTIKLKNDNPNYKSWKTGEFTFTGDKDFATVVAELNTYHEAPIQIKTPIECNPAGLKFNKEDDLDKIMDLLKKVCAISKVEKRAKSFIIHK